MSLHRSARQSFWSSSGLCQLLLTSKCKYVYSNEEFVWYLTAPSKDESSCRNNCDIWNVFRPRYEASNRSLDQLYTSFDKKEALYLQSVLFLYHFLFYCWSHQSTVRLNEHFLSLDLIIQKCDEYRMMLQDGTWNRYLHEVDEECHREVEQAVRRIMEKEGVDERLKAENPLEWVRRVNGIKMCVEAEVERRLCLK